MGGRTLTGSGDNMVTAVKVSARGWTRNRTHLGVGGRQGSTPCTRKPRLLIPRRMAKKNLYSTVLKTENL